MLESLFNKVDCFYLGLQLYQKVQHRCFTAAKFLRKSILKNASELTLESDYLEFCSWTVASKNILR